MFYKLQKDTEIGQLLTACMVWGSPDWPRPSVLAPTRKGAGACLAVMPSTSNSSLQRKGMVLLIFC